MALIISPGVPPEDNARIQIENDLSSFIRGTDITNFGAAEFAGEPIDFVSAATDPPATDIRSRGTLWFARGEGVLYKWTPEPIRSELFAPSEAGTNVSQFQWVAMSERKEAMVRCRLGWGAYELIRPNTAASEWKMEPAQGEERYTVVCCSTANTDGVASTGFDFADTVHFHHASFVGPGYITTETNADGEYGVVVEAGFCTGLVQGPGPGGTEPMLAFHFTDGDPHTVLKASNSSAMTNSAVVLGCIAQSAPSAASQQLQVLFYASCTNMSKASGEDFF